MTTAREYLRVSKDRSGRQRSNQEQQTDNRAAWDFDFGAHYSDATSASRYARKARDDWPRLIADINAGTFGAEVLVLWEGSRGSRRVSEWTTLLDLCETHGIRIAVTEYDRIYDPANPRDRKELIDSANDAEYESAKTSRRVLRNARSRATAGRPHGPVLFGYRRIYDPDTGELTGQVPDPDAAAIVRRIFTEYAGGRSARAIALRLNAEGITTSRGRPWVPLKIRRTIANIGYKGRRVHQGADFGPADWDPLVDDDLFDACERQREATSFRQGAHTSSLLSGLVRCAVCRGRMAIKYTKGNGYYGCQTKHCAYRLAERLDAFVIVALEARLARPDAHKALDDHPGEDPEVTAARERKAELAAELDDAMACWKGLVPGRKLSAQAYAEMESHLLPQIAECERRIRAADVVPMPLGVGLPEADRFLPWWDGMDAAQQHQTMEAWIVAVSVQPVGRGRRYFDDADYTQIEWRR